MAEGGGTRRQASAPTASTDVHHRHVRSSQRTDDLTAELLHDDERDIKRSTSDRIEASRSESAEQVESSGKPCCTKHDSRIPLMRMSGETAWAPASRPGSRPSSATSVYNKSSLATRVHAAGTPNKSVSDRQEESRVVDYDDLKPRAVRLANRFGRAVADKVKAAHLKDSMSSHSAAPQNQVAEPGNVPSQNCGDALDSFAPHKIRTNVEAADEVAISDNVFVDHSGKALDLRMPRKSRTMIEAMDDVAQPKFLSKMYPQKAPDSSVPTSSRTMVEARDEVAAMESKPRQDPKGSLDLLVPMRSRTTIEAVDEIAPSEREPKNDSKEYIDSPVLTRSRTIVEATMPEEEPSLRYGVSPPASPPQSPREALTRQLQPTVRPSSPLALAMQASESLPELPPSTPIISSIGNPMTRKRGPFKARLRMRDAIAVARASSSRSVYPASFAQEMPEKQPSELSAWRRARQVSEIREIEPASNDTSRSLRP
eukprot:scaffold153477_cov28-Tisochrysis_lutea.AAC.1